MSFRPAARQFFERRGAALPYSYQAAWIEADQTGVSDLNNGPYMKTAYIPQLDDEFHFYMVQGSWVNGNALFGTCSGFRSYAFATFGREFWFGELSPDNALPSLDTIYDISVVGKKVYANGNQVFDGTSATKEPVYAMNIYGFNNADRGSSYTGKYKFCGFTAHRNGIKIADYFPVVDFNNVACLYDSVSGEFFYNSRTGANMGGFTAGPKV